MMGWYKECTSSDNEKYYTISDEYYTICDRDNKKATEELKRHGEKGINYALFDSKDECQKICDKLNTRQGHPEWIYRMDGTPVMEDRE